MRKKLQFLILAILTISWIAVDAQEYHYQQGFDSDTPEGWSSLNTYASGNEDFVHNELPGAKAVKMKGTYSELTAPSVSGAGELSYWLLPMKSYIDGVFTVYKSTDGGTSWEEIDKYSTIATDSVYQKRSVTIDDASASVIIKFVAENGVDGQGLYYLDDVELTKLAVADDDANLASLTMNDSPVPGFLATQLHYSLTIDYTNDIPVFAGTSNNPEATVTVTQLTELRGDSIARTALIEVVSKDQTVTQVYSMTVTVSNIHFSSGIEISGDEVDWPGWMTEYCYMSTNIAGPGNHGDLPGDRAFKFMYKVDGNYPYLESPPYAQIKNISFWLFIEEPRTGSPATVYLETVVGDTKTALGSVTEAEITTDTWTQFTFDINSAEAKAIRFTTDQPLDDPAAGETEDATRIWMDDIIIEADPELGGTGSQESIQDQAELSYYPNPVQDILRVDANGSDLRQISLYNIAGQEVYKSLSSDLHHMINMVDFTQGIYIIKVSSETGIQTGKVIKR